MVAGPARGVSGIGTANVRMPKAWIQRLPWEPEGRFDKPTGLLKLPAGFW